MRQKHKTSRNATTITRNAICLVLCKKVLLPNTAHTTHEMSVRTPEQFLTSTLLDSQYTIALTVQNIAWKSTMKWLKVITKQGHTEAEHVQLRTVQFECNNKYSSKSGGRRPKNMLVWLPYKHVWQFASNVTTRYIWPTFWRPILIFFLKWTKANSAITFPITHSTACRTVLMPSLKSCCCSVREAPPWSRISRGRKGYAGSP